jgi:parvulin-like peptidyl-prolyl isomerase
MIEILMLAAFAADAPPAASAKTLHVVATVNGQPIARDRLADELIESGGPQQLDLMINRLIVEQMCKEAKIEVSDKEVDKDIENTLTKMRMKRKEFVDTVLARQGISFAQYRRDRVWPKLAMVKLVKDRVKVTDEDVRKGFEASFGKKVETRMLVVQEFGRTQELWEMLKKIPAGEERLRKFEDVCREYSIDTASRSLGGKVSPFNLHSDNPELEKAIFNLKVGELSSIMQIPNGNVIFLCVAHLPPQEGVTLDTVMNKQTNETVRKMLHDRIYIKLLQSAADEAFTEARKKARVENFLTGEFNAEAARIATEPPKDLKR